MLIWILTVVFVISGGWWGIKAQAQRVDNLTNEVIPSLQSQAQISTNSITQIQIDIGYMKEAQDHLRTEQISFRSEVRADQKENRVLLTEILREMKK